MRTVLDLATLLPIIPELQWKLHGGRLGTPELAASFKSILMLSRSSLSVRAQCQRARSTAIEQQCLALMLASKWQELT